MGSSLRLVLRRLAAALPTLALVTLAAYALVEAAPGDAVDAYLAQTGGDSGFAAELRRRFGLAASGPDRLAAFLLSVVTLNLGQSAVFARPVLDIVLERLPNTLLLMAATMVVAAGLGTLLGLAAGARPGSARDRAISVGALALLALPNFWLALLLTLLFTVQLGWLPLGGLRSFGARGGGLDAALDLARHLVLPALALGAGYVALYLRTLREGMVEAWRSEHVRAAQARGLPRRAVVWRAVARPALLPVVALLGQHVGTLVGGSIVIETVFAIPGMGRLAFEAVAGRDTPLLVGVVLGATIVVILANLVADLLLARLDPRIGTADA